MIVRRYLLGDEIDIEFTDVASLEWGDDDDNYAIKCMKNYYGYTIIDDNGYKNIVCFIPQEDGSEYVFFVKDKRSSTLVMRCGAAILDARAEGGYPIWSIAQPGQDKMHKFFKMHKTGNKGEKEIWVR